MSDADIKTLAARLRNQIKDTGIGQYKLSQSNPAGSGETWVQVGSTVTDTRHTLADQTYSASYEGVYTKQYTQLFEGAFNKTYTKAYEGGYNKSYVKTYLGLYEGAFSKEKCRP